MVATLMTGALDVRLRDDYFLLVRPRKFVAARQEAMGKAWQFFMGCPCGLFNDAAPALGGSMTVESFTMTTF